MTAAKIIDRLFKELKDSPIYATLANGRVKIRGGATYGEWAEIGRIIDPDHPRPIELAEHFMYHQPTAAKELRERIAQHRKDNPVALPYDEKKYDQGILTVAEQLVAMAREDDLDDEELADYITDAVSDIKEKIVELQP